MLTLLVGYKFLKWHLDHLCMQRRQMRQNPEKEMIEKLPNFLTFVPGQTDFERWKSFKMGQMNGYRTIPESFKNDRILRRRICPIFSTPIRIPAKVRLPNDGEYLCDNNGVPLLFEKIHFLALYIQQCNIQLTENRPQWWNINMPFSDIRNCTWEFHGDSLDEIELRILLLEAHRA